MNLDYSVAKKAEIDHAQTMCEEYPNASYSWYLLYTALRGTSGQWTQKRFLKKVKTFADFSYYFQIAEEELGKEIKDDKKRFLKEALHKFGGFIAGFLTLMFSLVGIFLFAVMPELIWIPVAVAGCFIFAFWIYSCVLDHRGRAKLTVRIIQLIREGGYSLMINQSAIYQNTNQGK